MTPKWKLFRDWDAMIIVLSQDLALDSPDVDKFKSRQKDYLSKLDLDLDSRLAGIILGTRHHRS